MTRRRKPPAPEPQPTDGTAWLASLSVALGRSLEDHEKGGKHRPSPPDATLDLGDAARVLGRK